MAPPPGKSVPGVVRAMRVEAAAVAGSGEHTVESSGGSGLHRIKNPRRTESAGASAREPDAGGLPAVPLSNPGEAARSPAASARGRTSNGAAAQSERGPRRAKSGAEAAAKLASMSTGAGAGPAAVDGPRMGVDMQQRSLLEAHLDQGLSGQTPGQAGRLKSDRQRAWTAELGVNGLMSIEYTPEDHRDGEKQDSPRNSTPVARPRAASESRLARFRALLAAPVVDIFQLRDLAWSGIPPELRPQAWRLLLGYAPAAQAERAAALKAKRDEYWHLVSELIDGVDPDQRSPDNQRTWRQIQVDVPRTTPEVRFFQHPRIRACIQRVLYVMSQRRTRTGYVQGMNDLLTPFLWTLLSEHLPILRASFRTCASSVDNLPEAALRDAEADAYGMFQSLLGVVQDNYTHTQPGIRRLALALQELTRRVDPALARHLVTQGADFLQFSLRWFNCLLVRELPFALSLRLWDTYVAELEQTQSHLLYASLALLLQWSKELQQRDFGGILTLLQRPPTTDWDEGDLESLLSKSFLLRSMLKDPKRGAAETGGSSV